VRYDHLRREETPRVATATWALRTFIVVMGFTKKLGGPALKILAEIKQPSFTACFSLSFEWRTCRTTDREGGGGRLNERVCGPGYPERNGDYE